MVMKTKFDSYLEGKLPKGCAHCVKGEKLVLFVTGLCPRRCAFCPISDEKWQKDVVYANEWKTSNIKNIIKEAELISAKGAGITGGDPLARIDRTIKFIKALKKHFGKFHIHLYTSLDLVDDKKLKRLNNSGLDEIRFDFDIDSDKLWPKIELVKKYDWDIGVEIPVIPGKDKKIWKIITFLNGKGIFLNLNELEIPDNSFHKMQGLKTKNEISYAVKGSEELALKLLSIIKKKKIDINVHYCTATLKDRHQLGNRMIRRAKNVKKSYDEVDSEGLLTRGAVYLKELAPGFGYRRRLSKINKKLILKKLKDVKKKYKFLDIDEKKFRLLTKIQNLDKVKGKNLIKAKVKEYPTEDQLEIEVEFID